MSLGLAGCGGGGGSDSIVASTAGTGSSVLPGAGSGGASNGNGNGSAQAGNTGNTGSTGSTGSTGGTGGTGGTGSTGGTGTPNANCVDLSRCLDFTAVKVARYKDNRQAAASYTFDDGYASSPAIASLFEQAGVRATFYIIPGLVAATDWGIWQDLSRRGHEIGNHSMTHPNFTAAPMTEQMLESEIVQSQRLIEQKVGVRPLTFAFPYHLSTARAMALAEQSHMAVRKTANGEDSYRFAYFDTDRGTDLAGTLRTVNRQLDEAVQAGGWFVAGGHGIDGDGWSPVTTGFIQQHLAHAATHAPRLWSDTFANVSRYRLCRDTVRPEAQILSANKASVRLAGTYNAAVCTAPLTVTLPVTAMKEGCKLRARGADGSELPVVIQGSIAYFNARPGETVSVELIPAPSGAS
ncbi:polysaccharide deacetylase family protein [Noviherbaspirillum sp. CPCC 100848]|uniref:Polysaccharide deacetylase family protein n=1 Tax=Noviherbaspirillum album TaxID=3080276 RepID=A0ABU6J4Z6_9BURK|nr:polysaccharide deacetylase family protein [Noviherbaspirillum sp. CPCC 100848]MEC4718506.1 polysaccharide deacetylase family protein [Noviherbaspirillum sp. CPCC 100848]